MNNDGHEYAPLRRLRLPLPDFSLPQVIEAGGAGPALRLSQVARGKKLVLVTFFAPWCSNWRFQSALLPELQRRYGPRGLAVMGVSEYAHHDDTSAFFRAAGGMPYPVVFESQSRDDRDRTLHAALRRAAQDGRGYGSPFSVLFRPGRDGAPPAEVWAAAGELVPEELERVLRAELGAPRR